MGQPRAPSLIDALAPIVVLIALPALTITLFEVSATDGLLAMLVVLSVVALSVRALGS